MLNLVLAHVNSFGVYFIENKLDFVSFDDKNLQRRRKFVGERDFPADFSMSESQQGPGICDVVSAKRCFRDEPSEKLWGGEGNFRAAGIFFVIKFLV